MPDVQVHVAWYPTGEWGLRAHTYETARWVFLDLGRLNIRVRLSR